MPKKFASTTTTYRMTEAQVLVLRFLIKGYEAGATPSVRDVCRHFGWSSSNAAHQHICALAKQGLVERRGQPSVVKIMPAALNLYGTRAVTPPRTLKRR